MSRTVMSVVLFSIKSVRSCATSGCTICSICRSTAGSRAMSVLSERARHGPVYNGLRAKLGHRRYRRTTFCHIDDGPQHPHPKPRSPNSRKSCAVVDFPMPIEPVSPSLNVIAASHGGYHWSLRGADQTSVQIQAPPDATACLNHPLWCSPWRGPPPETSSSKACRPDPSPPLLFATHPKAHAIRAYRHMPKEVVLTTSVAPSSITFPA